MYDSCLTLNCYTADGDIVAELQTIEFGEQIECAQIVLDDYKIMHENVEAFLEKGMLAIMFSTGFWQFR